MAKQKYWDGSKWVQVAPSMEEFEGHTTATNPHNITSEQINSITPKSQNAVIGDYPMGITAFNVDDWELLYPYSPAIVMTMKYSNSLAVQYLFTDLTQNRIHFRSWIYNSGSWGWTSWDELEFTSGHASLRNNPHNVTKSQVGLSNVDNVKQVPTSRTITTGTGLTGGGSLTSNRTIRIDIATLAEARAGLSQAKVMTPGRTRDAIDSRLDTDIVQIGNLSGVGSNGNYAIVIGREAIVNYSQGIAIGREAFSDTGNSVSIGYRANTKSSAVLALGHDAASMGLRAMSLGNNAQSDGSHSVAIGTNANADGNYAMAIGAYAQALNNEGVLGGSTTFRTNTWIVPGTFTVEGTKNFEMPHPDPDKQHTHRLRHSAVESPTAGDNLYRFEVEATEANETVEMELPDYFQYLNKDVECWVNGVKHFGRAYADVEEGTLKVTCETAGKYRVLVIGTRNDSHQSIQDWDIKGVEREIGESWTGETYAFSVDEIMEVEEIKEVI